MFRSISGTGYEGLASRSERPWGVLGPGCNLEHENVDSEVRVDIAISVKVACHNVNDGGGP